MSICSASSIHFGPSYEPYEMSPIAFMIEVAWAEVTLVQRTFFDFQCFSSEFEFFHDFIVLLATVTSAHATSIIKTIGDILKYL